MGLDTNFFRKGNLMKQRLLQLLAVATVLFFSGLAVAGTVRIDDGHIMVDFRNEMGPAAVLSIELVKTTRVPEDGREHGLPPHLGALPLKLARDVNQRFVDHRWLDRDVVLAPVADTQAMWINFTDPSVISGYSDTSAHYPFAIIVATGKINAINGEPLTTKLYADGSTHSHNYVVTGAFKEPGRQRWIDGYKVGPRTVRQFVAVSRDSHTSVEEYMTGRVQWGGIQVIVYPLRWDVWERLQSRRDYSSRSRRGGSGRSAAPEKDVAAGGEIDQEIVFPNFGPADFDQDNGVKIWITMVDHYAWPYLTGEQAPNPVLTPPESESPFQGAPHPDDTVHQKKW